jgi:hypothetical protein
MNEWSDYRPTGLADTAAPPWHRTVAVGVDGTPCGWQALAWAAEEAAAAGGIVVVCCRSTPAVGLELADPAIARAVAGVRARLGGRRVRVAVEAGDLGRVLVDRGADLVVVGAADGSAPSTARWVAAHAAGPVVVVRPVRHPGGPFAGHVVVGVDGSGPGRAALAFGFRYAGAHAPAAGRGARHGRRARPADR